MDPSRQAGSSVADSYTTVWLPEACAVAVLLLQVFRTRQQLFKSINPDYYGFRDEEDGVLLAVEREAEAAMQAKVGGVCGVCVYGCVWGRSCLGGGACEQRTVDTLLCLLLCVSYLGGGLQGFRAKEDGVLLAVEGRSRGSGACRCVWVGVAGMSP
jgi:hypothetical protein